MEVRSVAYNPNPDWGMHDMSDMQGMQGMHPMQGMYGMQGMPMASGLHPAGGYVNVPGEAAPGFVCFDANAAMACQPCEIPVMPFPQFCPPSAPAPRVYVVRKGDSVYQIARRFGTTMEAIIQANNLRNPDRIYPGQILLIPTAEYPEEIPEEIEDMEDGEEYYG